MKLKTSTKELGLPNNERPFLKKGSIFTPKKFKNLVPNGLKFFTYNAGFKKNSKDLLIIIFENIVNVVCVYSKTSTPSAPIIWDKKNNQGICKAVIVNSGNANAHTGKKGIHIIDKYTQILSAKLKCKKNQILVSSTGVIGEIFDPNLIIKPIKNLNNSKGTDLINAAKSILTTDTYIKTALVKLKIENKIIKIYGFAKGSGMVHPNMGTMLVYIFIECYLTKKILKKLLNEHLENTFNSITVDSDTSTSDTLMMFSSSKLKININNLQNYNCLSSGLGSLMKDLSKQVIKDGEGITKLTEITVSGAINQNQAKLIAFSIANSPLVKTAVSGEDANWGRIIMAVGKTFAKIKQNKIMVYFDKYLVCKGGQINNKINVKKLDNYMKNKIIKIKVDLGMGKSSKTVFGNDLSHEYLRINADYRS